MRRIALFSLLSLSLALGLSCNVRGPQPEPKADFRPLALWDHRPEAATWTKSAMSALDGHGAELVAMVPKDIDAYCPGYVEAGPEARKAFWVQFLSALAGHESTWRPEVAGGNGAWHGLLQISPGTAEGYGCRARSATELQDGSANLSCAIRIMAVTVPRDGVISEGMRGVAADWGPFHQAAKRSNIQAATQSMTECQG